MANIAVDIAKQTTGKGRKDHGYSGDAVDIARQAHNEAEKAKYKAERADRRSKQNKSDVGRYKSENDTKLNEYHNDYVRDANENLDISRRIEDDVRNNKDTAFEQDMEKQQQKLNKSVNKKK